VPGSFIPSDYLPIGLFILIALAFGLGSLALGYFLRPSRPYKEKLLPYESGIDPFADARVPFPMRYYIIAMLFVIFDIEIVFLYPWAVTFESIGVIALVEMFVFIAILGIGYVYAWKKGALEWD
jgi:NADH-quinone oxidoreductase subunit A